MLGKNQAKIFLRYYEQILSPSSLTSLHAVSHYLPLSLIEFCRQIFENIFFFLNLLVQKIFFDKSHWFQLLSTKNDWIISLFLISITLHSLSVSHYIMSSVCKRNKLWLSMKSHLTRENFVFRFALCLPFVFFVFVFWPIETTTANL